MATHVYARLGPNADGSMVWTPAWQVEPVAYWSPAGYAQGGGIATYRPATTTGDTQSPTVPIGSCPVAMLMCFGSDLKGTLQTCDQPYELGRALDEDECRSLLPLIDCAGTYGETEVIGSHLRIGGVENADSLQAFQVVCN